MLERRDIIRQTTRMQLPPVTRTLYFVDNSDVFGAVGRFACTIDMLHPNDIGYRLMSERLYPVLKEALETRYGKKITI